MTDQQKPDKQPEPDVSKSAVPPKADPAQAKSETVSAQSPDESAASKNQSNPSPSISVPEAPVKPSSNDVPKSTSVEPELAPKPAVIGPSDPTQPSKEALPPLSTVNLNDPRFKEFTAPVPSTGEDVVSKKEDLISTAPLPEGKSTEVKTSEPKVTQRLPDPTSLSVGSSPAAPASSIQICPTCGHRNRPGILLCENCGTNLMTGGKTSIGTRDLKKEEAKAESDEKLLDTNERKAVETAGGTVFNEDMVLRIEIDGGSTPMLVYPKQEIIMGRRDPNTGGMPDVDLTAYAGYRMGVSRRHAAIRLQEHHLHVSDLGSSNGTFLNGTRLNAHRPYQLRDGDEVRLGQMVLRVFFQSNKDRK
jgi:hypothetical protein